MAAGSGPPYDAGGETISDKKGEELNGTVGVEDEVEGKEEKKDGVKMAEPKDAKITEAEDSKMAESVDSKNTEAEDPKMVESEDSKTAEIEHSKKEEAEDSEKEEAEVLKDVEKGEEEEEGKETKEENDVNEERVGVNIEKKVEERKEEEGLKQKHVRGQKGDEKGEAKEKKVAGTKSKELTSTHVASSIERPVRERKAVERLLETLEKESVKPLLIEKGCGTPVKDIPNVAYKLAKKKPADLRLLHRTLFGRIGKAVNYKDHILQFSGFVWHENEEKQKTKVKEKLDKCVKDTLVDLCDLFDLSVSKTATRKEELVAMLLDFMVAPHASTDVKHEKEQQSTNSRKRKSVTKGSASKSSGGMPVKRSRKKRIKSEDTPKTRGNIEHETEDEEEEEEDDENGVPNEHDTPKHSESEEKEIHSEEASEKDEYDNDNDTGKGKRNSKKTSKRGGPAGTKKSKVIASPKPPTLLITTKSPTKTSSSKHSKADNSNSVGAKVFSRKRKNVEAPKKSIPSKQDYKEKATGKKVAKGRAKSKEVDSGPSKEELRKTICKLLNKVDFNTATFTDILKELASQYGMDLTPRKEAIKLMIQEELTLLDDEAEENEDVK